MSFGYGSQNHRNFRSSYDNSSRDNQGFQGNIQSLMNCWAPLRTPEQIEFDMEFLRWEKSFASWRRDFAVHSNTAAYRQYEQKFLKVREALLLKKAELYGPSLEEKLENQLNAATQAAQNILQRFGPPVDSNYSGGYRQEHGNYNQRSRSPVFRNQNRGRSSEARRGNQNSQNNTKNEEAEVQVKFP